MIHFVSWHSPNLPLKKLDKVSVYDIFRRYKEHKQEILKC